MIASTKLHIHCFGKFRALHADGSAIKWRTAKTEELLAFLIHHHGEAVDRFRIMDAIWGDDSKRISQYFNTTAHYLRRNLSMSGLDDVLEHNRGYYRLRMDVLDSDLHTFEQIVAVENLVEESDVRTIQHAIALYAGGYLEGNDYNWAEHHRQTLENRYLELIQGLSTHYMKNQLYDAAVKLLKKAIKHVPWSENVHVALIRAQLASHDRLAALKQYDSLKRMLRREFKEAPSEEIQRLFYL
ncbi:AfsR/SARP family transcriptional regulator [Paenibacillus sp. strain BS8-2]